MIKYYLLLAVIVLIVIVIKSPWFKGWLGELEVNLIARFFLDKKTYHIIKNVTLPVDGGTTQIDHIIVSRFGLFVIETKNIRGWIFGRENDPYWTQKIYQHSEKFQNPLRQNFKHVKTLSETLGIPEGEIRSMVVFTGDSTFKTPMPQNVTGPFGFISYIRSYSTAVLTQEMIEQILKSIAEKRLTPGLETHLSHVQNVKRIKNRF